MKEQEKTICAQLRIYFDINWQPYKIRGLLAVDGYIFEIAFLLVSANPLQYLKQKVILAIECKLNHCCALAYARFRCFISSTCLS